MKAKNLFIHEDAVVETTHVGEGTRIWRNVHIMPGAVIGSKCNIGEGCYIEGRVKIGSRVTIKNNVAIWDRITIEDDVFIGPAAVFTNDLKPRAFRKMESEDLIETHVEKGATIGANATVVCGIRIHDYAFIGAGSVVTRDVPSHHLVYGNPAAFKGFICRCTAPLLPKKETARCQCGLRYTIRGKTVVLIEGQVK
jgi:acetyltransferase-like isoleucine patch superfamily enzyme